MLAAVCMIISHAIVVADSRVVSNDGFGFARLAERVTSNHDFMFGALKADGSTLQYRYFFRYFTFIHFLH